MALTQADLDTMTCEADDCDHCEHDILVIVARCHPKAGVTVSYAFSSGEIVISCKECRSYVETIAIKENSVWIKNCIRKHGK